MFIKLIIWTFHVAVSSCLLLKHFKYIYKAHLALGDSSNLFLPIKEALSLFPTASPGIFSLFLSPFIYLSACSHSLSSLQCRYSSQAALVMEKHSCDVLHSFNHDCFIPPSSSLEKVGHCCHMSC